VGEPVSLGEIVSVGEAVSVGEIVSVTAGDGTEVTAAPRWTDGGDIWPATAATSLGTCFPECAEDCVESTADLCRYSLRGICPSV
jgi:hypothetical protein